MSPRLEHGHATARDHATQPGCRGRHGRCRSALVKTDSRRVPCFRSRKHARGCRPGTLARVRHGGPRRRVRLAVEPRQARPARVPWPPCLCPFGGPQGETLRCAQGDNSLPLAGSPASPRGVFPRPFAAGLGAGPNLSVLCLPPPRAPSAAGGRGRKTTVGAAIEVTGGKTPGLHPAHAGTTPVNGRVLSANVGRAGPLVFVNM